MSKQGIDFNNFEALDILWLIIFLIAIAIAVILMSRSDTTQDKNLHFI